MKFEKKTLFQLALAASGVVILYFLLHETERVKIAWNFFTGVFSPFVLGAVLAFILNVPMRAIERNLAFVKKENLRRLFALLLTIAVFALILAMVFGLLIPQIGLTIQALMPKLINFLTKAETFVRSFISNNPQLLEWVYANSEVQNIDWSSLIEQLMSMLRSSVSTIAGGAVSVIGSISGAVFDLVIGVVFAFYCLFGKETLARQAKKVLYAFLPEHFCDETIRILRLTNTTFSSFLSGQCLEACILGMLFAVAMTLLRMPYVPLISVLIAVTALVPLVGAFIGCFFGAFFILVDNPLMAVGFVVLFLILQQIEGNLIYPKVVGTSIGLPGMWVLVAVTVGGDLMGIMGMLIMIPLTSVAYTLLREISDKRLAVRNISPEKLGEAAEEPVQTPQDDHE